jgi:ribosomal protein S5
MDDLRVFDLKRLLTFAPDGAKIEVRGTSGRVYALKPAGDGMGIVVTDKVRVVINIDDEEAKP